MKTVLNNIPQNGFLAHLYKSDWDKYSYVKTTYYLSAENKTVKESNILIKELGKYIDSLPKDKIDNLVKTKKDLKIINDTFKSLDDFLVHIKDFEIDESNAKKVIKNLTQSYEMLSYISDYLTLAIDVHEARINIKKSKTYTAEELIKELLS